ncbi:MAG: ATP-binding protein, partial [Patescibacteria group bacterium]
MEIKEVLLIGICFLNLSLGILIYWNNRKNLTNIFFGLLALSLSLWSFGMFMYAKNQIDYDTILLWSRILYLAGVSVPVFFVFFSYSFPDGYFKSRRLVSVAYFFIFIILGALILFTPYIINDLSVKLNQRIIIHGNLYPFYFIFFFGGMIWAFLILLKKYYLSQGMIKSQLRFMLTGTIIPTIFAGVINMVLPAFQIFYYAWTGPIFLLVMVIFIGYAIMKVRLMDVKLIATQIFTAAITLFTLVEIFSARTQVEIIVRIFIFSLTLIFSALLIRSILKEVRRREEIENLANKLAQVNKRYEKINKQLQKANIELKNLDEAKSTFISIASHQLRTPLTAIKGYGSMLLDGDFGEITNPKQREGIRIMFVSGNRLINLVENLLNISRIESGRLQFKFEPKQLRDLAHDACETLHQTAEGQKLYLNFIEPPKPLPLVMMDEEKIRQVVLNFIDNAIKYTQTGGITVSVNQEGENIVCRVQDTGMGVSKDDQEKLFKKFSRGTGSFLVNTEGMGLGLYVADMMVAAHKGKVWIESEGAGKGSKFCFSLPAAESEAGKKLIEENKQAEEKREKEK